MTREEAINYFKGSFAIGEDDDAKHHNEVLEFTIRTLEQEPTKEEQALLKKWRDNRGISMEDFEEAMNELQNPTTKNDLPHCQYNTSQINEAEEVKAIPVERLKDFRNEVMNMNSIAIIQRLDKLIEEVEG